ncbi:hypothetical protein BOVA115_1034 [Bacteroides ovatus]|nr:hypothetical protein BOVA115_1034 [Bacteroides ovatus]
MLQRKYIERKHTYTTVRKGCNFYLMMKKNDWYLYTISDNSTHSPLMGE